MFKKSNQNLYKMTAIEFNNKLTLHAPSLLNFALKLTMNHEDARDIMQEALYSAMKNRDKFTYDKNLKGWLYTITRNIFINRYRRAQNSVSVPEIHETHSGTMMFQHAKVAADSQLNYEFIMDRVNELNDEKRIPFMMHFEGYKYHEIAEEMDIPIGTVKSRINQARKILHEKLHEFRV